MEPELLLFVAVVNLALLIWFIVTLNSINRNTKTIVEYIRSLAVCHPPSDEQARVINCALSVEEILAKLEARGTTVRLRDMPPGAPADLQVDNFETADPEMLRFVNDNRTDFIQFLSRRQRSDDA